MHLYVISWNAYSVSLTLRLGPRLYISNKFSGNGDDTDFQIYFFFQL